ncbi:MAG TPA: zf-HC2 domain-containing protein [Pyrinomonadaceae bacterium]|jgi:anti-sigma factor RsiW
MKECLEEGMIQAYVDGELSSSEAERVAKHAGACAACATAVSEAENELSLLSTAFEPELNLPVPSERLRERLNTAIGELNVRSVAPAKASRNLKGWLASLVPSFNFAPRHAFGFASLVAVVAFAAIFAIVALRRNENQSPLANVVDVPQVAVAHAPVAPASTVSEVTPTQPEVGPEIEKVTVSKPAFVKARRPVVSAGTTNQSVKSVESVANKQPATESQPLPGEVSYLKTIASLASIIETNGENAIKPSLRADYERNLALVDQAISATQRAARRNPKDPNAAEFLYSSYQSKIDLLSTVAEQGQMVAVAR